LGVKKGDPYVAPLKVATAIVDPWVQDAKLMAEMPLRQWSGGYSRDVYLLGNMIAETYLVASITVTDGVNRGTVLS
jgi:hypothetical protein